MIRVAQHSNVDLRTVKRAYEGRPVRQMSLDRIQASAKEMGFSAPGESNEEKNLAAYERSVNEGFKEGRYTGDASPPIRYNPMLGGNIKPSTRAYLELPITVRHSWEAYSAVNSALQRLAEAGIYQEAAYLVDAVRTDDRVIGCLSTRVNALFGLPQVFKWQGQDEEHASAAAPAAPGQEGEAGGTQHVGSTDDSPEVLELKQKICKLVEDNWNRMIPAETMKEIVGWGIMLNMGLGELVWAWDGDKVFPTIKSWHPQFVYWRWDTRSNHLIHQAGTTEIAPGDGRWVTFAPHGHNHGWLYGMIRAIGPLWMDRKFLWRDWARASEKFAVGIIKAFEPSDAPDPDKDAFQSATQNMVAESTVRLPVYPDGKRGFDLEMLKTNESSVNTDAFFETRIKRIDICIAVCLLGQNLSTEVSGNSGSRAAAQVHENVRADFLRADVDVLKQVISDQILSPFVRYNFEAEANALGIDWRELVPEVTWTVDPPTDLQKEADAIAKIASAIPNLAGSEADIHKLLDDHDIPVLDEKVNPVVAPPTPGLTPPRPRGPGGTVGVPPAGIGDPPRPDGSIDQPLEVQYAQLRKMGLSSQDALNIVDLRSKRTSFGNRSTQGLKPGARKGQLYADDLADLARKAGGEAMKDRLDKLLAICKGAKSYDDVRSQVKTLYRELPPGNLRRVVERAIVIAEMVGTLSAREDTRG